MERLQEGASEKVVDAKRTQKDSIYRNMGVVNAYAWKGYNWSGPHGETGLFQILRVSSMGYNVYHREVLFKVTYRLIYISAYCIPDYER